MFICVDVSVQNKNGITKVGNSRKGIKAKKENELNLQVVALLQNPSLKSSYYQKLQEVSTSCEKILQN